MTREQRDADRRERLLDAGLELFGTSGYAATSINDVCSLARVTARSFYDHFATREELLLAVYGRLVEEHAASVAAALGAVDEADLEARVEVGVSAAVRGWLDDPRRARIALLEIVGVSPAAERRRFEVVNTYVELTAAQATGLAPSTWPRGETRRRAVALVGAINESIIDFLLHPGRGRTSIDALVATLQRTFLAVLRDG